MVKRFLMAIGIILLILGAGLGVRTFIDRQNKKELITRADPVTKTAPTAQESETKPVYDKQAYSISDPESIWVVVNKKRPLNPAQYVPKDLVASSNGLKLRAEAAAALDKLITAAKDAGLAVAAYSAYRSYEHQTTVYDREVKENGQEKADTESARPGYSEHQTGWAVDLGGGGCNIEDCFKDTAEGKWVAENAYTYGFLVRYIEGKQAITGYRAEPWHVRYVGKSLATEMRENKIQTLEEFFDLPAAPDYAN